MPTENRRVAAYLPKHIDDRLESFKIERDLKGDSPALIAILEEFFEVSQEVAHAGSTPLGQRVDALESKVDELVSVLTQRLQELGEAMESPQIEVEPLHQLEQDSLSELKSELMQTLSLSNAQLKSELLSELRGELKEISSLNLSLGQLTLLPDEDVHQVENISDLSSEPRSELKTISQVEDNDELLNEPRSELKPMNGRDLASRFKVYKDTVNGTRQKLTAGQFSLWSEEKDPDDVSWRYNPQDKLYYPILSQREEQTDAEEF